MSWLNAVLEMVLTRDRHHYQPRYLQDNVNTLLDLYLTLLDFLR